MTSDLFQALSVVRDHPELAVALRNPSYGAAEKRELLERLFGGRISPVAQALLDRAVRPNLAAFVPTVGGFLRAAAELAGLTIARVTVARPLDESRTARLKAALEKSVGKPLSLQVHVDPSVIGGPGTPATDQERTTADDSAPEAADAAEATTDAADAASNE